MKQPTGYVNRPASEDPRDTEAWALTEAARRLIDAARNPDDTVAINNALLLNQRLWTIFQASLIDPECPLPAEIRENLLVLSVVVDRQTTQRLIDLDVTQFGRLININRAIASGLSQRPQSAAAPSAPQGVAAPSLQATTQRSPQPQQPRPQGAAAPVASPPAPAPHSAGGPPAGHARPAVKISI